VFSSALCARKSHDQSATSHTADKRTDGKDTGFKIVDVAARVDSGTGSLGAERYYVLARPDGGDANDDLILDVKRQGFPVGYAYLDSSARRDFMQHRCVCSYQI
jgi:uncharacterized protein (DUF2252 family)